MPLSWLNSPPEVGWATALADGSFEAWKGRKASKIVVLLSGACLSKRSARLPGFHLVFTSDGSESRRVAWRNTGCEMWPSGIGQEIAARMIILVCRKDMEATFIVDPIASYRHGCDPPGCKEDRLASPARVCTPRIVAVCGPGTPSQFYSDPTQFKQGYRGC